MKTTCQECGEDYGSCDTCDGDGWVEDPDDGGTMTCPECDNEPLHVCRPALRCPGCNGNPWALGGRLDNDSKMVPCEVCNSQNPAPPAEANTP